MSRQVRPTLYSASIGHLILKKRPASAPFAHDIGPTYSAFVWGFNLDLQLVMDDCEDLRRMPWARISSSTSSSHFLATVPPLTDQQVESAMLTAHMQLAAIEPDQVSTLLRLPHTAQQLGNAGFARLKLFRMARPCAAPLPGLHLACIGPAIAHRIDSDFGLDLSSSPKACMFVVYVALEDLFGVFAAVIKVREHTQLDAGQVSTNQAVALRNRE